MPIFAQDLRIINEHDGILPYVEVSFTPGPGHYGIELLTRMTTELEKKYKQPGLKQTTFGVTGRSSKPWNYLDDENDQQQTPGPTTYKYDDGIFTNIKKSGQTIPFNEKMAWENIQVGFFQYKKPDGSFSRPASRKQHYPPTVSPMKTIKQTEEYPFYELKDATGKPKVRFVYIPREHTAERFPKTYSDEYKYLLGPGSYRDTTQFGTLGYDLPAAFSTCDTTFGASKSIASPERKTAKDYLPPDDPEAKEYYGPRTGDKQRDYNYIYANLSKAMAKDLLSRQSELNGKDFWRAKIKLEERFLSRSRRAIGHSTRFKAPCPHFGGHSERFKYPPPKSANPDIGPAPGSYDHCDQTFNISERLKVEESKKQQDHFLHVSSHLHNVADRRMASIVQKNPQIKRSMSLSYVSPLKKREMKLKGSPVRRTSSFLGEDRNSIAVMARYGQAIPIDVPGPNSYPLAYKSSLNLNSSKNIATFKDKPIIYQNKDLSKSLKPYLGKTMAQNKKTWEASKTKRKSRGGPRKRSQQNELEDSLHKLEKTLFVEHNSPTLERLRKDFSVDRVKHMISHPHEHDFSKDKLDVDMDSLKKAQELSKKINRLKHKHRKLKKKEKAELKKLQKEQDTLLHDVYPEFFSPEKRLKGGHKPIVTQIHDVKPMGHNM